MSACALTINLSSTVRSLEKFVSYFFLIIQFDKELLAIYQMSCEFSRQTTRHLQTIKRVYL